MQQQQRMQQEMQQGNRMMGQQGGSVSGNPNHPTLPTPPGHGLGDGVFGLRCGGSPRIIRGPVAGVCGVGRSLGGWGYFIGLKGGTNPTLITPPSTVVSLATSLAVSTPASVTSAPLVTVAASGTAVTTTTAAVRGGTNSSATAAAVAQPPPQTASSLIPPPLSTSTAAAAETVAAPPKLDTPTSSVTVNRPAAGPQGPNQVSAATCMAVSSADATAGQPSSSAVISKGDKVNMSLCLHWIL